MNAAVTESKCESSLWLPPRRMRQYAIARVVGGALFVAIFVGLLAVQWSNMTMRIIGGSLIVLTAWVTVVSIQSDAKRMRGRQVECDNDTLVVTTPDGVTRASLADVNGGAWSEEPKRFGLSLLDRAGQTLARLDENIVADEAEARAFLRWLRTRTTVPIEVRWK